MSVRQFRRTCERFRAEGEAGLRHKARDRPSNNSKSRDIKEFVCGLLGDEYAGMGPTLVSDFLEADHGIHISPETLRIWMTAAKAWEPKSAKPKPRRCRARRARAGELAQMDTSEHDWFGPDEPKAYLISIIDDASKTLHAKFYSSDSTETNMDAILGYIGLYGLPRAIYTDKASHFVTNPPARRKGAGDEEGDPKDPPPTQIGRALKECGIQHIRAHSPQAKGRVERAFRTLQDRLCHRLRVDGIKGIEAANELLEGSYIRKWNERFGVPPADDFDAHRSPDGLNLKAIFSTQAERTVGNDYVIRLNRRRFQIEAGSVKAGLRRSKVIVETRLDGEVRIRYKGEYLYMHEIFHN
jgi:hypothetical protein